MPAERRREILFQCGGAARAYQCQWGGGNPCFRNPKFCFSRATSARNHALGSSNTYAREHEDISQQQVYGPQVLKEDDEAGERSYGQIIVQRRSIGFQLLLCKSRAQLLQSALYAANIFRDQGTYASKPSNVVSP